MIAHVRGEVAHRGMDAVVVDVNGVGYLVHVTDIQSVPPVGQQVQLHTSLQVREDAMDLYGFTDQAALRLFELLLTAAGVGPKLALAALRAHPPERLRHAIATGDQAVLTDVKGIGKKVAQRLVLELGDKVGGDGFDPTPAVADGGAHTDAVEALLALGYSDAEARTVLADAPADAPVEELVRHALRRAAP